MFKNFLSRSISILAVVGLLVSFQPAQAATIADFQGQLSQLQNLLQQLKNYLPGQVLGANTVIVSNDAELAAAIRDANGGETIQLNPGSYGTIYISEGTYNRVTVGATSFPDSATAISSPVTITSRDSNNPAIIRSIDIRQANNWYFDNLDIRPGSQELSFVAVRLVGNNIRFQNSSISYGDWTQWSENSDWYSSGVALNITSENGIVRNNFISGIYHGINVLKGSNGLLLANNTIDGIGGDAVRILSDGVVMENNFLKNFRVNDDNHDDCLQFWASAGGSPSSEAVITNNNVRNNICLDTTENNRGNGLVSTPQGFVGFDGIISNFVIENNTYISTAYHGINYSGSTNNIIRNNTIIDSDPNQNRADSVWIAVSGNKTGTAPATGNTISGNISNKFPVSSAPAVTNFTNNKEVKIVDYDNYFQNWRQGDVRLKSSASIQGVGSAVDPATVGSTRTLTNSGGTPTPTPTPTPTDTDKDTIVDTADNCVSIANTNQANFDKDTQGDVCDDNDDNDAVPDTDESVGCQFDPNSGCGALVKPLPSVSLNVSSDTVNANGSVNLTWSSSNASTCVASGVWSGSKAISGTVSSGALTRMGNNTFTLSCTGTGGNTSKSVAVNVTSSTTHSVPPVATTMRVMAASNLNVRSTPNGEKIGLQLLGAKGYQSSNPAVSEGGHNWVMVNFDNQPDGYVTTSYLVPVVSNELDTQKQLQINNLLKRIAELQALLNALSS